MSDDRPLYPAPPPGIPADLARAGLGYRLRVVLVLLALFSFLLLYLTLLAGAACLMGWAVWFPTPGGALSESTAGFAVLVALRVGFLAVGAMLFAFLVKGFFKKEPEPADRYLEVTEEDQPELFAFVQALCQEIRCPAPARLYLSHDVNAAVFYPTSILNLVVSPTRGLLLGLGLVNDLNLMEFKALLAHEFGHLSQRTMRLGGYVHVVYRVVHNMVYVEDRWDAWMIRGLDTPLVSTFAAPLFAVVEALRGLLKWVFRLLIRADLSLRRQAELNADLVAVLAAGSDAPVHALFKSDFAQRCQQQTARDLAVAAEQHLFSSDLFFHQDRAAGFLRVWAKNPELGRLPPLPAEPVRPPQLFQPGDTGAAAMWDDHPSHHDREQNIRRRYWRSPGDDRPAWLLFRDQAALRKEVTLRFYQYALGLEPEGPLADPEVVQAFTDEEHATGSFDARYHGTYDNRVLVFEHFEQALQDARAQPGVTPDQVTVSLQKLYADLETAGQRKDDAGELARFDLAVFTLHYHLARHRGMEEELCRRYDFQLKVQGLVQTLAAAQAQLDSVFQFVSSGQSMFMQDLVQIVEMLRQVRGVFAAALEQAGQLCPPPLKHLPPGAPLGHCLPAAPTVAELDPVQTSLDLRWCGQLHGELGTVLDRLNRVRIKSLAGLLAFQEQLADQCGRAPVADR
jgi:Zn-dependent protease with chaperone function